MIYTEPVVNQQIAFPSQIGPGPSDFYDGIVAGAIYSVMAKESNGHDYLLAKILEVSGAVVHIILLEPTFKVRPRENNIKGIDLSLSADLTEARARHLAMSRKLFAMMRPVLVCHPQGESDCTAVQRDRELAGLRQWRMLEEKDVVQAPELKSESNAVVFARIFFHSAAPFALLQIVFHYFSGSPSFTQGPGGSNLAVSTGFEINSQLIHGLIALAGGIVFGLLMVTCQYIGLHRALKLPLMQPLPPSTATAFQVCEQTLVLPFEATYLRCLEALKALPGAKIINQDCCGTIEGEVSWSLLNEGQKISINVYAIDCANSGVIVCSMPKWGGEVDFGCNLANVQKIVANLNGHQA